MSGFVGRARELAELRKQLEAVTRGDRADPGVAVILRGRRRIGKSRLAAELIRRSKLPAVHFQAARGASPADEFREMASAIARSTLPDAAAAEGIAPESLTAALTLLAGALPDSPSIVVLDEVPWLLEGIPGGAGELQRVFDTRLSKKPVLLLLLGSDLAMMENLTKPDQVFYGRAVEMMLGSLSPADIAAMTGLSPFDAFDAFLVTGGLPLVAQEWSAGMSRAEFLHASFESSTSALVVSGARSLDAEFGEATVARQVLAAIGGMGERTFSGIQGKARGAPLNATSLSATLARLTEKRVVAVDTPLSTKRAPKDKRYRIGDPGLRFWLAFVEPALAEVDRGRPDLALDRVRSGFESWRGRAVEPVVREALARLLPDARWPAARAIGGWWPRTNTPEIDLVAADGAPASALSFIGTIKWRRRGGITRHEARELASYAVHVPGAVLGTPLVGVCPAGPAPDSGLAATWTAQDLLAAWP